MLCFLCIAAQAAAQGTTASLAGTVTRGGKPAAGVEVTIRSTALQAMRTVVTGEDGTYAFPSLPPGLYVITFVSNGQTATLHKTLSLASSVQGDIDLQAPGVSGSITVQAATPTPMDSTDVVRNFSWEQIQSLPRRRNLIDTAALAPGVNQNGPNNAIMISGGMSYDNLFLIDGIVVGENVRGQPHNAFIEDAIQEVAVLTGSISAEYGRFTGGVVSAITKSGGNTFSGTLRDTMTNASWIADAPIEPAPHDDQIVHVLEGTLGGYVLKDRLWFFGAARRLRNSPANGFNAAFSTRVSSNPQNVNPTVTVFRNTIDENRFEGKFTTLITPSHSFVLSLLHVDTEEHNVFTSSAYDADSVVPTRGLPVTTSAIAYNAMLAKTLLLDAQYSRKDFSLSGNGSRFTDRILGTVVTDFNGNWNAAARCGVCGDETRDNDNLALKSTWLLNTRRGTHAIAGGAENFREKTVSDLYSNGSGFTIVNSGPALMLNGVVYPRFTNASAIMYAPVELLSPGTDIVTRSAFVNDKWDYKRFNVNLGLRYDKNHAVDSSGHLVSDDSAFSPRLGLLYDLKGDHRFLVNASYSHYVTKITDTRNVGDIAAGAGRSSIINYRYVFDPVLQGLPANFPIAPQINPAGSPPTYNTRQALELLFNWFNALTDEQKRTILTQVTIPGYGVAIPHPVDSTYVREIVLGFGAQLGSRGFARVDLIDRNWQDFIVRRLDQGTGRYTPPRDFFVLTGAVTGDLTVLANDDGFIAREYRGAQLQFGWSRGRFSTGGGYTYSTLKGNDLPETDGNGPLLNDFGHFYPEYLNYPNRLPYGYLDGDQRHRARVWAGYDLPLRRVSLNASVIQSYDSGRAYSAIGLINPYGNTRINFANSPFTQEDNGLNSPYTRSALTGFYNYFFSKRGEFRTDDTYATDLALNLTVPIRNVQFFAQGQVLNVFNGQAVNNIANGNINMRVNTRVTSGTVDGQLLAFNPYTEVPVEGKNYTLDPNFGKPVTRDAYQQPRTYRFSIGARF